LVSQVGEDFGEAVDAAKLAGDERRAGIEEVGADVFGNAFEVVAVEGADCGRVVVASG
jgi:hypothetical protein